MENLLGIERPRVTRVVVLKCAPACLLIECLGLPVRHPERPHWPMYGLPPMKVSLASLNQLQAEKRKKSMHFFCLLRAASVSEKWKGTEDGQGSNGGLRSSQKARMAPRAACAPAAHDCVPGGAPEPPSLSLSLRPRVTCHAEPSLLSL